MPNYQESWKRTLQPFWHYRLRELLLHIAIYIPVNLSLLFDNTNGLHSTSPYWLYQNFTWLFDLFSGHIPWLTINWGVILLLHIGFVVTAAGWSRFLRHKIAREYDRQAADIAQQPPTTASKKKRQSSQTTPDYVRLQDYQETYEKAEQR